MVKNFVDAILCNFVCIMDSDCFMKCATKIRQSLKITSFQVPEGGGGSRSVCVGRGGGAGLRHQNNSISRNSKIFYSRILYCIIDFVGIAANSLPFCTYFAG